LADFCTRKPAAIGVLRMVRRLSVELYTFSKAELDGGFIVLSFEIMSPGPVVHIVEAHFYHVAWMRYKPWLCYMLRVLNAPDEELLPSIAEAKGREEGGPEEAVLAEEGQGPGEENAEVDEIEEVEAGRFSYVRVLYRHQQGLQL